MTRDEIAQAMHDSAGADWGTEAHFQRFAALVEQRAAAAEREACREIAFRMAHSDEDAVDVSHAIRARGET